MPLPESICRFYWRSSNKRTSECLGAYAMSLQNEQTDVRTCLYWNLLYPYSILKWPGSRPKPIVLIGSLQNHDGNSNCSAMLLLFQNLRLKRFQCFLLEFASLESLWSYPLQSHNMKTLFLALCTADLGLRSKAQSFCMFVFKGQKMVSRHLWVTGGLILAFWMIY